VSRAKKEAERKTRRDAHMSGKADTPRAVDLVEWSPEELHQNTCELLKSGWDGMGYTFSDLETNIYKTRAFAGDDADLEVYRERQRQGLAPVIRYYVTKESTYQPLRNPVIGEEKLTGFTCIAELAFSIEDPARLAKLVQYMRGDEATWREGCKRVLFQTTARLQGANLTYFDSSVEEQGAVREKLAKQAAAEGKKVVVVTDNTLAIEADDDKEGPYDA
jgi:hypothetical protein